MQRITKSQCQYSCCYYGSSAYDCVMSLQFAYAKWAAEPTAVAVHVLRMLGGCVTLRWTGLGPAVGPPHKQLWRTGTAGAAADRSQGNHSGSSLLRTRISGKSSRPEGGIEPLRLSTPTGLKPATRTTECHLDDNTGKIGLLNMTTGRHNWLTWCYVIHSIG